MGRRQGEEAYTFLDKDFIIVLAVRQLAVFLYKSTSVLNITTEKTKSLRFAFRVVTQAVPFNAAS